MENREFPQATFGTLHTEQSIKQNEISMNNVKIREM